MRQQVLKKLLDSAESTLVRVRRGVLPQADAVDRLARHLNWGEQNRFAVERRDGDAFRAAVVRSVAQACARKVQPVLRLVHEPDGWKCGLALPVRFATARCGALILADGLAKTVLSPDQLTNGRRRDFALLTTATDCEPARELLALAGHAAGAFVAINQLPGWSDFH